MSRELMPVADIPKLRREEFNKIRSLARQKFGLELKPGKEELVLSRLGKKLRQGGFASFDEYYNHVTADRTGESLVALIDALTTNYTMFFREADHFEFLQSRIVPELRSRDEIRIWCAAAATGEEPYSLAFTLFEALGRAAAKRIRILATDISSQALARAARGIYPTERFQHVPQVLRQRYLLRGAGKAEGYLRVRPEVRNCIEFRRLNLIERFPHQASFPVIFCRNVMIYFSQTTRRDVVNRLVQCLEPGGHFFVGPTESLAGRDHPLDHVQPAIYRKKQISRWKLERKGAKS